MGGERRGGGPHSREADSVSCLYISMGTHGWRPDEGRLPSQYGGSPPLPTLTSRESLAHRIRVRYCSAHDAIARTGTISTYA